MRLFLNLLVGLIFVNSAMAQDKPVIPSSLQSVEKFTIQLTEYRAVEKLDDKMSSEAILATIDQLRKNNKIELMETIRLSAIDQFESVVQLGKNVSLTTGITTGARGGAVQSTTAFDIGTIMNVLVQRQGDSIAMTLSYTVSRLSNANREDRRPDIDQFQLKTKLLLKLDEPQLVTMTSAEKSSFVVMTIKK